VDRERSESLSALRRTRVAIATLALFPLYAAAEPYLAVESGLKCGSCHVNPSGAGKRKVFGTAYAQAELTQRLLTRDERERWTGEVNHWLAIGADLRTALSAQRDPGAATTTDFAVSRATLYAELTAIARVLTLYVDEQIAPGGAINREAYALLTPPDTPYTVKAGRFFLPYGLRLQDDSAFIRQATGINFDTPDTGLEVGVELPRWSAQVALTNGTGGAAELDTGKQASLLASYVLARWRVGFSYNFNNAELGDREMHGVFAGVKTGPIAWLAEIDRVTDDGNAQQPLTASLVEADWRFRKGDTLKITYEQLDRDASLDISTRERWSLVWERFAIQTLQFRVGLRSFQGATPPQTDLDEVFAELHLYL
jgi:hypothetical protein